MQKVDLKNHHFQYLRIYTHLNRDPYQLMGLFYLKIPQTLE